MFSVKFTSISPSIIILCTITALLFHAPKSAFAGCLFRDHPYLVFIHDTRDNALTPGVFVHANWVLATHNFYNISRDLNKFPTRGHYVIILPGEKKKNDVIEILCHYRFSHWPLVNDVFLLRVKNSFEPRFLSIPGCDSQWFCKKATMLQYVRETKTLSCLTYDIMDMDECKKAGALRAESVVCATPQDKTVPYALYAGNVLICESEVDTLLGVFLQRLLKSWDDNRTIECMRASYYIEFFDLIFEDKWEELHSLAIRSAIPLLNLPLFCSVYLLCIIFVV